MIAIRPATTDSDLEAWIRVRRAVLPEESGGTVTDLRAQESEERLVVLAELDGELAGSGYVDRSQIRTRFGLAPRVLPEFRRRGVGTALLRELAAHAERFDVAEISALVDDEGSRAFAECFGFVEVDRQVEQVKTLVEETAGVLPEGIEVATVAERPELLREAFPLATEGYADLATDGRVEVSLEEWLREEATLPAGSFVALADGEIVGYSGLMLPRQPGGRRGRPHRRAARLATARPRSCAQAPRARVGCAERAGRGGHLDAAGQRGDAAPERAARLRVPRGQRDHVRAVAPPARLRPFVRRRGLGRRQRPGLLCF